MKVNRDEKLTLVLLLAHRIFQVSRKIRYLIYKISGHMETRKRSDCLQHWKPKKFPKRFACAGTFLEFEKFPSWTKGTEG